MLSQTSQAIEHFDNQHDFERMAADILNALGYAGVDPMAPGGGPDGGVDIRFQDAGSPGIACVTLRQDIEKKFHEDVGKVTASGGLIALFCRVCVSPQLRMRFTKAALDKGYRLDVFDLERLRSLLDNSLKEIRRRY